MSDFNYGADPVQGAGGSFKNALEGKHAARVRSIIHHGMFQETFDKKKKAAAPEVTVIFELKEETDFDDDGTTPLEISKSFPLRKGDKAFLTKFMAALDTDKANPAKGFDDFIGRCCEVELKGGKEKGDDGLPKYINFAGISSLHPKLVKITDELSVAGVGHIAFADITVEAIKELHPIREVADILLEGMNYVGSKAEQCVAEIRADNADFAIRKAKTDKPDDKKPKGDVKPEAESKAPQEPAEKPAELDENEEF